MRMIKVTQLQFHTASPLAMRHFFFTTLDLTPGYFQVAMIKKDREKVGTFMTLFGLFEWTLMLFDLCNALATL